LTSEARIAIQAPGTAPFEIGPHHCFACGTLNEHGLHLDLHLERRQSWVELALDDRFEGWDGVVHGGIVSTILDEVMAWALVAEDNWGLTARLNVAFKAPVNVGQMIRAEGWIIRERRRIVDTEARLVDQETGTLLATATGVYVAADAARRRELQARYGVRPLGAPADDHPDATDTPHTVAGT
jgi:acyl-coenzyme A thioesterase PaaI-like protein